LPRISIADSLDLVELVMALEEAFDVTVEETELEWDRDDRGKPST